MKPNQRRERSIAIDVVRDDIAQRLRRVCANFPPEEFDKLVDRIAEIDARYQYRDDWEIYREAIAKRAEVKAQSLP